MNCSIAIYSLLYKTRTLFSISSRLQKHLYAKSIHPSKTNQSTVLHLPSITRKDINQRVDTLKRKARRGLMIPRRFLDTRSYRWRFIIIRVPAVVMKSKCTLKCLEWWPKWDDATKKQTLLLVIRSIDPVSFPIVASAL